MHGPSTRLSRGEQRRRASTRVGPPVWHYTNYLRHTTDERLLRGEEIRCWSISQGIRDEKSVHPPDSTDHCFMAAVKSKDTTPELVVRRLVHALGYRYRLYVRSLPWHARSRLPTTGENHQRQRLLLAHARLPAVLSAVVETRLLDRQNAAQRGQRQTDSARVATKRLAGNGRLGVPDQSGACGSSASQDSRFSGQGCQDNAEEDNMVE